MSLYTERHGMRIPIERTYTISIAAYSLLFDCCARYFDNLAWLYPEECPDGNACCGMNYQTFSDDMKYEIPTLFRREGIIDKPHTTKNIFDENPKDDEFDQYAIFDLIEFVAQNMRDIVKKRYHSYFNHYDIELGKTNTITKDFIEDINKQFNKLKLAYQLTDAFEIERIEETSILSETIEQQVETVQEVGIKELLVTAIQKHKSPYPNDQKDSVEKIWDALERLKSYYTDRNKKQSAEKIVNDMAEGQSAFATLFDTEFKALTDIGNKFRIRHHETDKIDITDARHYDYFFNRCLSLIALALHYLE